MALIGLFKKTYETNQKQQQKKLMKLFPHLLNHFLLNVFIFLKLLGLQIFIFLILN